MDFSVLLSWVCGGLAQLKCLDWRVGTGLNNPLEIQGSGNP